MQIAITTVARDAADPARRTLTRARGSRDMIGIKILAVSSVMGLAGVAQVDPVTVGNYLGGLQPASILGIVAVACVIGLVRVNNAKDKLSDRLYDLIQASTIASQEHADNARQMSAVLVELKDAVKSCRGNGPS